MPERRPLRLDDTSHPSPARERQELAMRWILLATVLASVVASTLTTLVQGPPPPHAAIVQGGWLTILGWLVRRLFR